MTVAYDEFPGVSASRMRALGDIAGTSKTATVAFGDVAFVVPLALVRFPNGGSWSFFVCPCGRKCRTIRLYEGGLACSGCLRARGFFPRVQLIATAKRGAYLAPKRLARLTSSLPARVHPRPGRMLDRRAKLELSLRRSLIVERLAAIEQFEKDVGKA